MQSKDPGCKTKRCLLVLPSVDRLFRIIKGAVMAATNRPVTTPEAGQLQNWLV
jgi:hypothetical protein